MALIVRFINEARDDLRNDPDANLAMARRWIAEMPRPSVTTHFPPRGHDSVVYYIRLGDLIKIGYTTNLPQRMAQLSLGDRAAVLATEPGALATEQRRHLQFAHLRRSGEWFDIDQDLLAHIDALATAAA